MAPWGVHGSSWGCFGPSWGVLKLLLVAIEHTSKIIETHTQFSLVFKGWGPSGKGCCGGLGAFWTVLRRLHRERESLESALRADEKLWRALGSARWLA